MGAKEAIQSSAMWAGYYSNHFARELGKDLEKLSRPLQSDPYDLLERIKRSVHLIATAPLSLFGLPLSLLFLGVAYSASDSRLEIIKTGDPSLASLNQRQITVMSLNSCFQEGPFAALTGGIVAPFENAGRHPTRVAAIADWISSSRLGPSQASPDIFVGQEFHDLKAQDAFMEEMKKQGYRYFILDRAPHPVLNNSGLFVASKRELADISFIPFPMEDRQGLAKGTQQGAIAFSVLDDQKRTLLRVINTHLNYGSSSDDQKARNRQLKNHVVPLFRDANTPTILVGDFNFDTSDPSSKKDSGLEGYTNIFEGQYTCTDEGKILLRGKQTPPELEKIDALFANSHAINISRTQVERLEVDGTLLSDHFSLSATIDT